MSERVELQGACLCGKVRVSVKVASRSVGACHCKMCRKWTGGPLMVIECDDEVGFEGEENETRNLTGAELFAQHGASP